MILLSSKHWCGVLHVIIRVDQGVLVLKCSLESVHSIAGCLWQGHGAAALVRFPPTQWGKALQISWIAILKAWSKSPCLFVLAVARVSAISLEGRRTLPNVLASFCLLLSRTTTLLGPKSCNCGYPTPLDFVFVPCSCQQVFAKARGPECSPDGNWLWPWRAQAGSILKVPMGLLSKVIPCQQ